MGGPPAAHLPEEEERLDRYRPNVGVVLFNGVIVGCIVTAMFLALIDLISEAALW